MNTTGYNRPVITAKPSIQGEWHERMDLLSYNISITTKTES